MLWKCYSQYDSKYGKLSSGHRTGKDQFSFHSQRKAMSKNAQTMAQLHSSHTLTMATHSSTLVWKIPWMEEPGRLQSTGSRRVRHNWATALSLFTFMHWRRKWQPTPVFLPGESQGQGSVVGCRLWGCRVGHGWCNLAAAAAHASKVMLKILQVRLQQYVNHELPDVQAGFRKGRGTRDQMANIHSMIEKAREFQKNIYFCFIDYAKAFNYVDHNKLWKILKEMGIPDHLTFLLRNLYAGKEATVRTGHGTTDWFQIGKGVCQGCIFSPCLFNLYAEYIMRSAGLNEAQTGIKIARRNTNNLR